VADEKEMLQTPTYWQTCNPRNNGFQGIWNDQHKNQAFSTFSTPRATHSPILINSQAEWLYMKNNFLKHGNLLEITLN
jgi:hypothetical protein